MVTDTKITLRPDPTLLADLDILTAAGAPNRTAAIRDAVHAAAQAVERARRVESLRAEAERLRNDPVDRAAVAEILADFADDDWPTDFPEQPR